MLDGADTLVECPSCQDQHTIGERDDVDGRRECPECGEPTAKVIDSDVEIDLDWRDDADG